MDMGLPIVASSEEQEKLLLDTYTQLLRNHDIPDPKLVATDQKYDNMTKWPVVLVKFKNLRHI